MESSASPTTSSPYKKPSASPNFEAKQISFQAATCLAKYVEPIQEAPCSPTTYEPSESPTLKPSRSPSTEPSACRFGAKQITHSETKRKAIYKAQFITYYTKSIQGPSESQLLRPVNHRRLNPAEPLQRDPVSCQLPWTLAYIARTEA